jgi:glutamyl-tRNA synthetase
LEILKKSGRVYEKDGALYFRVSGQPQLIHDLIRGDVLRKEESDFVIVRSNGKPVFHLVNVIDDMLMEVTHVIRGEDHLSNSSKHVELFNAFGAKPPLFVHIPLILKSQGSGKMSKRETGALVEDYQKSHFIPEAVRNYLCLLGWSPKKDREILPIDEIIDLFDVVDINVNNARFDEKKMAFFNGEYVKALPFADFCDRALRVLEERRISVRKFSGEYVANVLAICQEKLRSIAEVPNFVEYFFTASVAYDRPTLAKLQAKCDVGARIVEFRAAFVELATADDATVEQLIHGLAQRNGLATGDYIHSIRFALSGRTVGPGLFAMIRVFGKKMVVERLDNFLQQL